MACETKLAWYELVPVFSFVGLRGRCRTCKTKIAIQYPLVELATGIIFTALFLKFQDLFFVSSLQFALSYAYHAFMFSLLLVIATYDLKHKIIPDGAVFTLGFLSFLGLFIFRNSVFYLHLPSMLEFSAGFLIAAPFAFFWLVSRGKWMGFGDAKLAIGLGWLLGLTRALSGLAIAFWAGAIVGTMLIIFSKKYGMRSEIPFAPYLVLGTFLAFIFELNLFVGF